MNYGPGRAEKFRGFNVSTPDIVFNFSAFFSFARFLFIFPLDLVFLIANLIEC